MLLLKLIMGLICNVHQKLCFASEKYESVAEGIERYILQILEF